MEGLGGVTVPSAAKPLIAHGNLQPAASVVGRTTATVVAALTVVIAVAIVISATGPTRLAVLSAVAVTAAEWAVGVTTLDDDGLRHHDRSHRRHRIFGSR
jgi:hypothetical protein